MTFDEFLKSDLTLEQYAEVLARQALDRQDVARAAARRVAEERLAAERAAFHDALLPVAYACGVRPSCVPVVVERAATVFQLRDGRLVPRPGVVHPRDPCAEYDPVTWLADLRRGAEGEIVFSAQR